MTVTSPSASPLALLLRGTVIHSASRSSLHVLQNAVLGVSKAGRVAFLEDGHTEALGPGSALQLRSGAAAVPLAGVEVVDIPPRAFIVPGLVDTHTHAPQFSFAGTGYDLQLLEWLETYTFPSEAKFADLPYAASVCKNAVRRTLGSGSTSCVYFGTIHTDAAILLGRIASAAGQRAYVGKVSMDRNAPDFYRESTRESLDETERFVNALAADAAKRVGADDRGRLGPPAVPVITPRFVPTCTSELMRGLAEIASRHELLVQSHVSENRGEIAWVGELHPTDPSYTECYASHGLLTKRTILAHGIYLSTSERALLREKGAAVSHCPMSNFQLRSGMLNVRRLLDEGVHVALGTDVSGGASPSMLSAIREALKVSNMVSIGAGPADELGVGVGVGGGGGAAEGAADKGPAWKPLSFAEAFWLATVGGASTLGTDGLTGDLRVGAVCDAIVIDPEADGSPFDAYAADGPLELFQKWLQLGDDRNTAAVYVDGRRVLPAEGSAESFLNEEGRLAE